MSKTVERWAVLPDEHIPYHDSRSVSAVEKYLAAHRWDGVISLGDFLDFDLISRWTTDKPRRREGHRVKQSLEIAAETLRRRLKILRAKNGACRYVLIQGNHDARLENYLDENPVWEGLVELDGQLELGRQGVEWVPFWTDPRKTFTKGKATFIHGLYTNQYHAAKHVRQYGKNIFYGHTHDVQEHCQVMGFGANAIVGKSFGCLCDPGKMHYIRGKPQNWVQAVGTIFFLPDGTFTDYLSKIIGHRFVGPDGVVYSG